MKKLRDLMSPLSWLVYALCALGSVLVFFQPTGKEFLVYLLVDILPNPIFMKLEARLFRRFFPSSQLFFDGINLDRVRAMNLQQRSQLVRALLDFPRQRALWAVPLCLLKILPATLVIVFYWHHHMPEMSSLLVVLGISSLNITAFYSLVRSESHLFISGELASLHAAIDMGESFAQAKIEFSRGEFVSHETVSLLRLFSFAIFLQFMTIYLQAPGLWLFIKIGTINLFALLLFSRVAYLRRRFLLDGLELIFASIESQVPAPRLRSLALHSEPILGRFEQIVNRLFDRVRRSELELMQWVSRETEKSRFQGLGQMAAMVAHDLSAPFHVIQFCVQELKNHPDKVQEQKYMEFLTQNVEAAQELVLSLRARVRDDAALGGVCQFKEACEHVWRLLHTQYSAEGFDRIQFAIDPALAQVSVLMNRVELTQVMDNVLRNAVLSLLSSHAEVPRIDIGALTAEREGFVRVRISDNGPGFSKEKFTQLFSSTLFSNSSAACGLGLKLTRSLVEAQGGQFKVTAPRSGAGAEIVMELPLQVNLLNSNSH